MITLIPDVIEMLNAITPISILARYTSRVLHFSLSTRQKIMAPIVKNIILKIIKGSAGPYTIIPITHAIEMLHTTTPISILARYAARVLYFSLSTHQQIMAPIVKNIILKLKYIRYSTPIIVMNAIEALNAATPISILLTRQLNKLRINWIYVKLSG